MEPTTRELEIKIQALDRLLGIAIEQQKLLSEKLAAQYREDKASQNEWRQTVNDMMALLRGKNAGISTAWGVLIAVLSIVIAIYAALK